MIKKENLEQIEQSVQTVSNNQESKLGEVLGPDYPKIELSVPNEDSPKIRTYEKNNSYFARKGTCRSERSRTYSIQDLVTIETSSYCSPDGKSYGASIDKINLFPSENDLPEEYDNTVSSEFGSGQYDYLSYDEENKRVFQYSTGNQLSSQNHYFWVSLDSTILFPGIETVQECNGGYFHHIIIDNKSDYKAVDGRSIQETINALVNQKRGKEKLEEYRERNGDIGIELPWTIYSSGYYQPRAYIGDEYGIPAHEYSNERWNTRKMLVKFGNPGDCVNFYRGGVWYTVCIDENKRIDLDICTGCSWSNSQNWRYEEIDNSNIQSGQIFINGKDVYEDTMQHVKEIQKKRKEKLKLIFEGLNDSFVNTYSFSKSEFMDLCRYAGKGKVIKFLSTIKSMLENSNIQKEEIMSAMVEIKYPGDMIFRNYVLIKRKAKKFKHDGVKRVLENGYARKYLADNLPGIEFVGYFDEAMGALKLAFEKGLFRKDNFAYTTVSEPTVSDLGQALIDAGVVSSIKS